jgi:hypothetical protein
MIRLRFRHQRFRFGSEHKQKSHRVRPDRHVPLPFVCVRSLDRLTKPSVCRLFTSSSPLKQESRLGGFFDSLSDHCGDLTVCLGLLCNFLATPAAEGVLRNELTFPYSPKNQTLPGRNQALCPPSLIFPLCGDRVPYSENTRFLPPKYGFHPIFLPKILGEN